MSNIFRSSISFKIGTWLIQKRLQKRQRVVQTKNLSQAKSIAIVVNLVEDDAKSTLQSQLNLLKKQGIKKIDVLAFKRNWKTEDKAEIQNWIQISPDDFDWLYLPQKNLKNVVLKDYDILINLATKQNKFVFNLLTLSKAKFKVGLATSTFAELLDFTINVNTAEKDKFLKSLHHYLTILNKN